MIGRTNARIRRERTATIVLTPSQAHPSTPLDVRIRPPSADVSRPASPWGPRGDTPSYEESLISAPKDCFRLILPRSASKMSTYRTESELPSFLVT